MGYSVSSEPEHFLECIFIVEKYEFFLFPTVHALFSKTALISIQGVTGGMCETSGECSLGQTIPI